MEIKIAQPDSNADFQFTQPLYYFGQYVIDKAEDEQGIVRGMTFCDDEYIGWEYTLYYPDLGNYGRAIREDGLQPVLEG